MGWNIAQCMCMKKIAVKIALSVERAPSSYLLIELVWSQSELLLLVCHTATVLSNLHNFLFVLFVKMSSQTSPVCAVQDLSNVWAACGQPLGEAEYWARHKSVGVL